MTVTPITQAEEREWCARLMASTPPWTTLGRGYEACLTLFAIATKEHYLIREGGRRVGLLVLDMTGPFPGYIQSICVAADARRQGLGRQAIAWAEERIFRDSPNVFICVSSFNHDARRLYEQLGYQVVGQLDRLFVDDHHEWLLRKSRGSWQSFRRADPVTSPPAEG